MKVPTDSPSNHTSTWTTKLLRDSVGAYIPEVERMARGYHSKLPSHFRIEDLIGAAYVGLIEASQKFDHYTEVPFMAFASHRIFGSMKDFIRSQDTMTKSERRAANAEKAREKEETVAVTKVVVSEDPLESGESSALPDVFGRQSQRPDHMTIASQDLHKILTALPKQDRELIVSVHVVGLTFQEIGAQLKLPETKVCKMYNSALMRARSLAMSA